METQPFMLILAALVAVGTVMLVRYVWLYRSVGAPTERLVPVAGRFDEKEIEVLGHPPQIDPSDSGEAPFAAPDFPGKGLSGDGAGDGPLREGASPDKKGLNIAAGMDGVSSAAGYGLAWAQVDEHLFQAVEHMTNDSVSSIADLGRVLQEHEWAATSWNGAAPGLVQSVKGHLAEWLVRDDLLQAGHEVVMPELANQAGWDMLVDGQPVNVKAVEDAASVLREHFSSYPDIGVLLPRDAANIPEDALHFDSLHGIDEASLHDTTQSVLVDDMLSQADVADAAETGLNVAAGQVDFQIPWITMAISGFRETRLLLRGHTDLMRATKNIAVDTIAVGGGGLVGMETGAAIGTAIVPGLGTLIGGALGGIAGAFVGRFAGNAVKRKPLENAKAAYESALGTYKSQGKTLADKANAEWGECYRVTQAELTAERDTAEREARATLLKVKKELEKAQALPPRQALDLLRKANDELVARVHDAERRYRACPWWQRWLWPSRAAVASRRLVASFREDVAAWAKARESLEQLVRKGAHTTAPVFDVAMVANKGQQAAAAHLVSVGLVRSKMLAIAEKARGAAVGRVLKARAAAIVKLQAKREKILETMREQMKHWLESVLARQEAFVSELKKAGIDVPAAS